MIFLALSLLWLGRMISGLFFVLLFLVLAAALVRYFTHGMSPIAWSLQAFAEPIVRPVRRALRPLPIRFDISPFVAAAALYLLQWAVMAAATMLAGLLVGPYAPPINRALVPYVTGLRYVLWAYQLIVLLRVLVTWFGSPEHHPFVQFLARWVDPVLYHIRRLVRPQLGRLDLTPFVLLAALSYLEHVVLQFLLFL